MFTGETTVHLVHMSNIEKKIGTSLFRDILYIECNICNITICVLKVVQHLYYDPQQIPDFLFSFSNSVILFPLVRPSAAS